MKKQRRGHPFLNAVASVFSLLVLGLLAFTTFIVLSIQDNSPVPDAWNPTTPFALDDQITWVTDYKFAKVLRNDRLCLATLDAAEAEFTAMDPLEASELCHVRNRVEISRLGKSALAPLETQCATALRLAMWEYHSVQPAAQKHFGQPVTGMRQIGSYNCRSIRGVSDRMSTHATASAIDIGGFTLADGAQLELIRDWDGSGTRQAFLREIRDAACRWFETTLGPAFNDLHADHFHLQSEGWGTCR